MVNADDLRRLAGEMASAYQERVQHISAIKQETADLLKDFDKADKERAEEVSKTIADFDRAHAEMSKELKAKLASDERERKTQTQAEIRGRKEEVSKMLVDFRKEQAETAAAWKDLLSTMQSAKGRPAVKPVEVEETVKKELKDSHYESTS